MFVTATDFPKTAETLRQTKTGQYFLYFLCGQPYAGKLDDQPNLSKTLCRLLGSVFHWADNLYQREIIPSYSQLLDTSEYLAKLTSLLDGELAARVSSVDQYRTLMADDDETTTIMNFIAASVGHAFSDLYLETIRALRRRGQDETADFLTVRCARGTETLSEDSRQTLLELRHQVQSELQAYLRAPKTTLRSEAELRLGFERLAFLGIPIDLRSVARPQDAPKLAALFRSCPEASLEQLQSAYVDGPRSLWSAVIASAAGRNLETDFSASWILEGSPIAKRTREMSVAC